MLFYIYLFFALCHLQVETEAGKQPKFKVNLMTITKCNLPKAKWSPEETAPVGFTIKKLSRDTTVMSCNFTVDKRVGPVSVTYRTYQLQQNSAKNLMFKLERLSCTNPMTFKVIQMLKINITKDCFTVPGHFYFENFNLDKLAWLLTKSLTTPGKYAYEIEFNEPRGVLSCYDLVCDLIERKQ